MSMKFFLNELNACVNRKKSPPWGVDGGCVPWEQQLQRKQHNGDTDTDSDSHTALEAWTAWSLTDSDTRAEETQCM